jgi:hypothetical protein
MAYITPRVKIAQEFTQVPSSAITPLPAFVLGPNYHLVRYSESSEKDLTALGTSGGVSLGGKNSYVYTANTSYDFPNVPTGAVVDPTYTKVYAEKVQAQYFPLTALGVPPGGADTVVRVLSPSGQYYTNKVRFSNTTLATANGYSRSALLSNRDARAGDLITVTGATGGSVTATIKAITPETYLVNGSLAAVVSAATNASGNKTNTTELNGSVAYVGVTDGALNSVATLVTKVANPLVTYVGYPELGIVSDSYTITVTSGSTLADAKFSIDSASGAFSRLTEVGISSVTVSSVAKKYLICRGDVSDANYVAVDFTSATAFVVGASWTITGLRAAVTRVTPAATGTYTGSADMVYTLRVDRGGAFYDSVTNNSATCARLVVSASDIDTSSVVLPKQSTSFGIGSFGVQVSFSTGSVGTSLVAGDIYYVAVTAAKTGAAKIVELAEEIPSALLADGNTLTAKLLIAQDSIQIPAVRDLLTGSRNWTQSASSITVNSDITTYDTSLVSQGTPVRLPILVANLYVEHRDLLQDGVAAIDSVNDLASVSSKLGTIHPDNTLAQGVYDAVLNSGGQTVYFISVASNDLAGYVAAIKVSEKSEGVYSFAPLTFDQDVQQAVVSHVNAYSRQEVGRWRIAWLSVPDQKTSVLYDKNGTVNYTATVTADPTSSAVINRLVTVTGAKFLETGVRPGDSVRINYRLDSDGNQIYDEYTVASVKTNISLLLNTGLSLPISSPVKVNIVRNFTRAERASNIAAIAHSYNDRRVRIVFPDTYKDKSIVKQGYFAAAGLAGLRSGVVPHQGLTNSQFLGATELSKVVIEFTQDDLDVMAAKGVWIIAQETLTSLPYVRHQLTTSATGVNTSEDSITTNVDSISYALKAVLSPFVGRYNINPETVGIVRAAISAELSYRATTTFTARAGNQLVSFTPKDDIISVAQNPVYKDSIDAEVRLNVPYPMNYINLKLTVS